MTVTALADLYRHMEWADARAWSAALACEAAGADVKVRDLIYHTHLVQHAFLRTWRGEPMDRPFPTFTGLAGILPWARQFHADARPQLGALGDAALSTSLPVAWAALVESIIGRAPAATTVGDTVLQVALHSIHHRGQVCMRLRELGETPPLVDYIAWVWFGRPGAEWPAGVR